MGGSSSSSSGGAVEGSVKGSRTSQGLSGARRLFDGSDDRIRDVDFSPGLARSTWQDVLKGGGYWQDSEAGVHGVDCCENEGEMGASVRETGAMGASGTTGGILSRDSAEACELRDVLGSNFTSFYVLDWLH
jgi:hypothetical protein